MLTYDFILDSGNDWDEGPEGCDVSQNQAEPGDIIKYDWENDGEWDHVVIIVQSEDDEQGNRMHWIAAHTDDHDNYPFTYYNIHPDMIYRFVHIERINISASRGFNTDGILASYYNDQDDGQWELDGPITWDTFTPPVVLTRLESYIAFDTGTTSPAPGVNGTFWSTIWEGTLHVPQDGNYIFRFKNLDDGARLYVDDMDTPLLESWLVQGFHNYQSAPVTLNAGPHNFRVEFAQGPGNDCGLIVEWDLENVFREKIGPYSDAALPPTSTPTFTPTFTPSPTPVPTNTPVPTATPIPTNTPAPTSPPPWWQDAEIVLMQDESVQQQAAFSELLSRIRDDVLKTTPKGDAYIDVIYKYAPEIMILFMRNDDLRQQVKALALDIQPLLEATLSDESGTSKPRLEEEWIKRANEVLDIAKEQVSQELRAEIEWWQKYLPEFSGKTGKEIWEMLPER